MKALSLGLVKGKRFSAPVFYCKCLCLFCCWSKPTLNITIHSTRIHRIKDIHISTIAWSVSTTVIWLSNTFSFVTRLHWRGWTDGAHDLGTTTSTGLESGKYKIFRLCCCVLTFVNELIFVQGSVFSNDQLILVNGWTLSHQLRHHLQPS